MRISDWSSDVCSSDLRQGGVRTDAAQIEGRGAIDVSVLIGSALTVSDARILSASEALRQAARDLAEIGLTRVPNVLTRHYDPRRSGWSTIDPGARTSGERRGRKEWVRTCSTRRWREHFNK